MSEWSGLTRERASVVMTSALAARLETHLHRGDGQEDLCFVLWRPSVGAKRASALLVDLVLPERGERHVHGNVDFETAYFLRASAIAADADCGIGLIHCHPRAGGWQGLSADDVDAESSLAAQAGVLTGLPLLGLTMGMASRLCSARFWIRTAPRTYEPWWCESVRTVGDQYRANYNPDIRPIPRPRASQVRTISAWGDAMQADLARIRVGVVGAGSVGAPVAESLARMGVTDVTIFDFDTVEEKNLDRLLHATQDDADAQRSKVEVLASGIRKGATSADFQAHAIDLSLAEPEAFSQALDLDVLFSCVDRPWARQIMNYLAYAHLIPVIDGGVGVEVRNGRMRGAEWRAHVAAPGRRCLECLRQYEPADVSLERTGALDDPHYIAGLPPDSHLLKSGENVFAFAAAAAAAETLQFLSMVVAPAGYATIPPQIFHFTTGTLDHDPDECEPGCLYQGPWLAMGDGLDRVVTGPHSVAEGARAARLAADCVPAVAPGDSGLVGQFSKWLHRCVNRLRGVRLG